MNLLMIMNYYFCSLSKLVIVIVAANTVFLHGMQVMEEAKHLSIITLGYNSLAKRYLPVRSHQYNYDNKTFGSDAVINVTAKNESYKELFQFLRENDSLKDHIKHIEMSPVDSFIILPADFKKPIVSTFTAGNETIAVEDILQNIITHRDLTKGSHYVLLVPSIARVSAWKLFCDRKTVAEKALYFVGRAAFLVVIVGYGFMMYKGIQFLENFHPYNK